MRVAVVIPALNEASCIGDLVREVWKQPVHQVIVVDNGSSDDTANMAKRAGARVVYEPRRGYGYACAAGVAATDRADVVVFLDGDFSFLPNLQDSECGFRIHALIWADLRNHGARVVTTGAAREGAGAGIAPVVAMSGSAASMVNPAKNCLIMDLVVVSPLCYNFDKCSLAQMACEKLSCFDTRFLLGKYGSNQCLFQRFSTMCATTARP